MKKRDLIIIASILVIAIGLFLLVNLTKKPGANVVVRVDGEVVAPEHILLAWAREYQQYSCQSQEEVGE